VYTSFWITLYHKESREQGELKLRNNDDPDDHKHIIDLIKKTIINTKSKLATKF
jgi:hypothetical protein